MTRRVGDIGEFELIARLAARLGTASGVAVGIGDDTAVLDVTPGMQLLATTDGQVEGVHFLRDGTPPGALGHRALASNLSDVAAMGGRPRWALVALSLPSDMPLAWIEALYDGMGALARRHDVAVVGGNVARSTGGAVVDVTLLGEVDPARRLTRAGARPGDVVVVTGAPGASAGGLELVLHPELRARLADEQGARLLEAHWRPEPRIEAGQHLAAAGGVSAMIDISDGLAGDLGHILAASGVGATLNAACVPVGEDLAALESLVGRDALELVLHGGEAYELLFTCAPDDAARLIREIGIPAHCVGQIDEEPGLRLRRGADVTQLPARGHDHFKPGATP